MPVAGKAKAKAAAAKAKIAAAKQAAAAKAKAAAAKQAAAKQAAAKQAAAKQAAAKQAAPQRGPHSAACPLMLDDSWFRQFFDNACIESFFQRLPTHGDAGFPASHEALPLLLSMAADPHPPIRLYLKILALRTPT